MKACGSEFKPINRIFFFFLNHTIQQLAFGSWCWGGSGGGSTVKF